MAVMSTRGDSGDNSEVDAGASDDSGSDVEYHYNISVRRLLHISPFDLEFGQYLKGVLYVRFLGIRRPAVSFLGVMMMIGSMVNDDSVVIIAWCEEVIIMIIVQ